MIIREDGSVDVRVWGRPGHSPEVVSFGTLDDLKGFALREVYKLLDNPTVDNTASSLFHNIITDWVKELDK